VAIRLLENHPLLAALRDQVAGDLPDLGDSTAPYAELPARLVAAHQVTGPRMLEILSRASGLPPIDLHGFSGDSEALGLLPRESCDYWRILPLAVSGDRLALAMADPWDLDAVTFVEMKCGRLVEPLVCLEDARQEAAARLYASSDVLGRAIQEIVGEAAPRQKERAPAAPIEREDAPVIKLVNYIIEQGVNLGASDIHLEPTEDGGRVRYRIDGTLHEIVKPPAGMYTSAVSRIKVMAGLDVSESRFPQDGRMSVAVGRREVDLRVSTIPFADGEGAVLRILDKTGVTLDLEALGYPMDLYPLYERGYKAPHGMILVAGPTGSGKSTTLYATVKTICTPEIKVISVEDPVEYRLKGMMQSPIHEEYGYTFEMGLRAILRHDPDVVMIGEIRDQVSAEIAVRAALTGHLVFSTIHTNDSVQALTRLQDMGIPDYLVRAVLRTVISQRLVRRLCPVCRRPVSESKATFERLGLDPEGLKGLSDTVTVYEPVGCPECKNIGYRGRTAIFEVLDAVTLFRHSTGQERSVQELTDLALRLGLRTLRANGLRRVLDGTTSLQEVLKVTSDY
jgi:type IV pilus assembly protein PilB